jgi:transposase
MEQQAVRRTTMTHYAGLDVSLKEVSICVVDDDGEVVAQGPAPADPEGVAGWLKNRSLTPKRIIHESGQLSIWLQRGMVQLGLPAICIDARKDLEGHIRGVLKVFGIRMTGISQAQQRQGFRDQLAAAGETDPVLRTIADGFIAAHITLCKATADFDATLRAKAKSNPITRRLMTIPGVGPIVSLSFAAHVDDPNRFSKTTDVGAFLGLTPRRHQSGEMDWSGRVSKCGDAAMRSLLFEAATSVIRQVKRFSSLKSWAVRLAARRGFRKAAVATARKIAVLMLTLWKSETDFKWTKGTTA